MAFNLRIVAARATAVQIQAEGASGYTLLVSYRLCLSGPSAGAAHAGTAGAGTGAGSYQDVVIGTGERMMTQALPSGHPLPVPADLAALVRSDCQQVYGGQPDAVIIGGVSY